MINMKKILFILTLSVLTSVINGQDVNKAVDDRVKPLVTTEVTKQVGEQIGQIEFDTLVVKTIRTAGNIDTLTTPGIYQLSVTGTASAVRFVVVNRNSNGNYSIRTSNPLAWSGSGTWATSVVNNRVIVSTTNNNIIYQREKIQ